MDYLLIQASSVLYEMNFSSNKETCTTQHSYLSPNLIEALQLLKSHVRQENLLDFTDRLSIEDKIRVLELEA